MSSEYWGKARKPQPLAKSASQSLEEKRRALAAHTAEDREEFKTNWQWRQELKTNDPAKYDSLRASCVAANMLPPLPEAPQTTERRHTESELRSLANWSDAQIDAKLKTVQNDKTQTLAYMKEHQPEQYFDFVQAAVLRGKMPAERLEALRHPIPKPATKPEPESTFELNPEDCQRYGFEPGHRVTLAEYQAITKITSELKRTK